MEIEKILVTGRIYETVRPLLSDVDKQFRFLAEEEVCPEDFTWADAYVSFRPTANFSFGNLKWVHSFGAGVDSFLLGRDWKEDVLLTRTICSFGQKISEYCLSYMLREVQKHEIYASQQKKGVWQPIAPRALASQCVVIYGTGEIGQELARTFVHFGVQPIGVSRSGAAKPYFAKVVRAEAAGSVLAGADWVISTLPLTEDTAGIYDESWFSRLNGAAFVNVGRGGTVKEQALLSALAAGFVRQAILDVFVTEPLPAGSPLWQHPQVVITPHISAITEPEEAVQCFLDTLQRIEQDLPLANRVSLQQGY